VGTVGDAVAEGDDGGAIVIGDDVDTFQEIPAKEWSGGVERGGGDGVAWNEVVGLIGKGMECQLGDWLIGEEEADGEIGRGSDFQHDGVADDEGTGWDDDRWCSAECERICATRGDVTCSGAKGDLGGADGQGVEAEFVSKNQADRGAADGDVDDLAEGRAVCSWGAEFGSWIFGRHGRCCPGAYPPICGCCSGGEVWV